MPKLTKRIITALCPDPAGERFCWDAGDGALKGFAVRVQPSGVASYFIQYRTREGRTRRLVLGRVGVLTPDQARALAADKLYAIAHGADPSAERRAARTATTLGEILDWYLADAAAGKILGRKGRPIKASTLAMDRSRIEHHVKPLLGRRAVAGLTPADFQRMHDDIIAGRTARKRPECGRSGKVGGGRFVAARVLRMLSAIFEHARRYRGLDRNPARGVRVFADAKRETFLTFEQIAALGKAMREAEAEGRSRTGIAAVRALILTGCRRNEILCLTWSQFDAKGRCLRFDDTKTGAQIRPIGAAAVEHLARQPKTDGIDWVFPADRGDGRFVGVADVAADLSVRAKLPRITPHVLRHSFASAGEEVGLSQLTIGALLGHAGRGGGATRGYIHHADTTLLAAADKVAARIAAELDGAAGAEVVPLRRAQ